MFNKKEKSNIYAKKILVESSDVDPFLELKLSSLFLYLQDVATEHAEALGVGKSETQKVHLYWVITRYAVTIHKLPKYCETMVVKTYAGPNMKFIYPRYFQVESESGEVLITASSTWMLIDDRTHRVSMNSYENIVVPYDHIDGEESQPIKVEPSSSASLFEERVVRYSDIDLNGHLNNTKYIEYICDTHNYEFYKTHRISHVEINYEREVLDGDLVRIYKDENNPEYIRGEANGVTSFETLLTFTNRE